VVRRRRLDAELPVPRVRRTRWSSGARAATGRVEAEVQGSLLSGACPLGAVGPRELRYRFSLGDGVDVVSLLPRRSDFYPSLIAGVVCAGAGADGVGGDHVFGGPGRDGLTGNALFGGPGNDTLHTKLPSRGRPPVAHGGSGDDVFDEFVTSTPGWYYGGPGMTSCTRMTGANGSRRCSLAGPDATRCIWGTIPAGLCACVAAERTQ
jgi:hypothetical protein